MTYWKTQHFKALQRDWYKRLEDVGFKDAERIKGDELELKQNSFHSHRGLDDLARAMKEAYFYILSCWINDTKFKREIDRVILTWYSEGKNIKTICDRLESLGLKRCRGTVRFTIRKYEMIWGMRTYSPKQLNLKTG